MSAARSTIAVHQLQYDVPRYLTDLVGWAETKRRLRQYSPARNAADEILSELRLGTLESLRAQEPSVLVGTVSPTLRSVAADAILLHARHEWAEAKNNPDRLLPAVELFERASWLDTSNLEAIRLFQSSTGILRMRLREGGLSTPVPGSYLTDRLLSLKEVLRGWLRKQLGLIPGESSREIPSDIQARSDIGWALEQLGDNCGSAGVFLRLERKLEGQDLIQKGLAYSVAVFSLYKLGTSPEEITKIPLPIFQRFAYHEIDRFSRCMRRIASGLRASKDRDTRSPQRLEALANQLERHLKTRSQDKKPEKPLPPDRTRPRLQDYPIAPSRAPVTPVPQVQSAGAVQALEDLVTPPPPQPSTAPPAAAYDSWMKLYMHHTGNGQFKQENSLVERCGGQLRQLTEARIQQIETIRTAIREMALDFYTLSRSGLGGVTLFIKECEDRLELLPESGPIEAIRLQVTGSQIAQRNDLDHALRFRFKEVGRKAEHAAKAAHFGRDHSTLASLFITIARSKEVR